MNEPRLRVDPARERDELRAYLGDRYDEDRLTHYAETLEAEWSGCGDEGAFYRTSEAYLYNLTAFAMTRTKEPYLQELARHVAPGARILDYGCGYGFDAAYFEWQAYDPYYGPTSIDGTFDTILCNHVLNMLTRTSSGEMLEQDGILMTAVDTGWITDERPHPTKLRLAEEGFHAPLDLVDGAARVYDPIVRGELGEDLYGCFLKDYAKASW